MKLFVNPSMERFRPFLEELPARFGEGELLFQGRNEIRGFEVGGERVAVKRFRKPSGLNALFYGHLRKSKARRAFEHGMELGRRGIPTPESIGWREDYAGLLLRESYLVTRYSTLRPISEVTNAFPAPHTVPVLDAFAAFAVEVHRAGIEHEDFNNGNTQWGPDGAGGYRFELIDINRMHFRNRPLTKRESLHNLRRITCPMTAYTYILGRYGELRGWDNYYTQLHGCKRLARFITLRDWRYGLKRTLLPRRRNR